MALTKDSLPTVIDETNISRAENIMVAIFVLGDIKLHGSDDPKPKSSRA